MMAFFSSDTEDDSWGARYDPEAILLHNSPEKPYYGAGQGINTQALSKHIERLEHVCARLHDLHKRLKDRANQHFALLRKDNPQFAMPRGFKNDVRANRGTKRKRDSEPEITKLDTKATWKLKNQFIGLKTLETLVHEWHANLEERSDLCKKMLHVAQGWTMNVHYRDEEMVLPKIEQEMQSGASEMDQIDEVFKILPAGY